MVAGPGSLVELDLRFARSRRRSALRRAALRRAELRRRLRLPAALAAVLAAVAVAGVGGSGSLAGVRHASAARPAVLSLPLCPVPASLRPAFAAAARSTGLPLALLAAVASVESRMDQTARSEAGARGLMQVMPATAAALRLDSTQAQSNVLAGARYLQLMLRRYGSTDLALAAYNAGPTAVDDAGGRAPSSATLSYVANVQSRWRTLAGCR